MICKRILVGVDFSNEANTAVDYAVFLARALGASITLFHVLEPAPMLSPIVPGADDQRDTRYDRQAAQARLDQIRAHLHAGGFDAVETSVAVGNVVSEILSRASAGVDLIALGTHGRTGVSRALMGSIAEGVIRRAPIPVVTVHLPKK